LVLHAECQIGKTGSYLATIALLKHLIEGAPALEAVDEDAPARLHIPLDGTAWLDEDHPQSHRVFVKEAGRLRFPHYHELRVGKYHARVLLDRLALPRRQACHVNWAERFAAALDASLQELPVCNDALRSSATHHAAWQGTAVRHVHVGGTAHAPCRVGGT
jgi:hypothetical protein